MTDFESAGARPASPDFDITEAAMSGLRMIARKPKVLAWWIGFNLIFVGGYLALMFWLFGDIFRQFFEMIAAAAGTQSSAGVDQGALKLVQQIIPRLGLAVLLLLPLGLLYSAM